MKCDECNIKMESTNEQYHFTECGLDNVYLLGDAVERFKCPECGEISAVIPDIRDLMHQLATGVADKQDRLTGQEVRFLRKRLKKKSVDFARMLGITPEHLSRIENGHEGNDASSNLDRLVRYIYHNPDYAETLVLSDRTSPGTTFTVTSSIATGLAVECS